MSTKKFFQLIVLVSVLVASFTITTGATAAYSCGMSVTVVSGDTLRKIADRCGTTVYALRRANPMIGSGDLIYPDQLLLLPGALVSGNNGYSTYIVMRGDTLKSLAYRFGTSMDVLVEEHDGVVAPAPGGGAMVCPRLRRLLLARFTPSNVVTRCARSQTG